MLDTSTRCRWAVWSRCWAADHFGGYEFSRRSVWNCHHSAPSPPQRTAIAPRKPPAPTQPADSKGFPSGGREWTESLVWKCDSRSHGPITPRDEGWRRGDLWVMIFFKVLSLLQGRMCCRRKPLCSDWRIRLPPPHTHTHTHKLPYYLTLFGHHMPQQRVDRAISYPPELVLHTFSRASSKI